MRNFAEGVKKRRRKAGEIAGRKQAVRNFCLECCAYNAAEVNQCSDEGCWLWPWRLGGLDGESVESEV